MVLACSLYGFSQGVRDLEKLLHRVPDPSLRPVPKLKAFLLSP